MKMGPTNIDTNTLTQAVITRLNKLALLQRDKHSLRKKGLRISGELG